MECHVCLDAFDAAERRPKSLPCGHTFCLHCLQGLPARECPLDKELFQASPEELPDNFMVLQLSTSLAESAAPRWWCRSCNKAAAKRCLEEHDLCSVKRARTEDAAPLLETLKRGEAGLKSLGEALAAAARDLDVQEYRAQLQQETAGLAAARGRLQEAAGADAAAWEQAKEAAGQGVVSRLAAQLAADLADPSATCSVTVRRGAAGDVAWRGEVRPAEDAAARLLLCGLACRGDLQPEQIEGEQRPADADLPPDQHQGEQRPDDHQWQDRPNEEDDEPSLAEMAARMVEGCRVERGSDWEQGWTEDGDPPGPGTVVCVQRVDSEVQVKWDSTGECDDEKWYSVGRPGMQHVRLLGPAPLKPYIAPLDTADSLDVKAISTAANWEEMAGMLADAERLDKVRSLVGLHCSPCPPWSLEVLQRVAPRLESLQMLAPQQQHLDVVAGMRELFSLSLTDVTAEQLQQLSRIYFDRLEVHCTLDARLEITDTSDLPRLRCGVYPLSAALTLVGAYAETLQELQLVAASEQPYGCPDLAAELRRCGLTELRRMVLVRQTASGAFCRHDAVSCKKQKGDLWAMFLDYSNIETILCSICNRDSFKELCDRK